MNLPERIRQLIEDLNHTPASFADEIGVQRSSISHVVSGRNKPSLEFIEKLLIQYPDTDIYWLITGDKKTGNLVSSGKEDPINFPAEKTPADTAPPAKRVEKIVLFYGDGTFMEFGPAMQ